MDLIYNFEKESFIQKFIEFSGKSNTTIYENIFESLKYFLIKPENPTLHFINISVSNSVSFYDKYISLKEYIEKDNLDIYYTKIDLYTELENPFNVERIILPDFIEMKSIFYGSNSLNFKIKNHDLKTKNRITVEILHLKIKKALLIEILNSSNYNEIELLSSKLDVWNWKQTFYNKISGKSYFCECFRNVISQTDVKSDHPHVVYAFKNESYLKDICHICSKKNSDLFFCHPMYGSQVMVKYGSYIKKCEIEEGIDIREAENKIRIYLGIPRIGEKWVNETLLFNFIRVLFSDYSIFREASPEWLGRQRLDIFIPDLRLAIEYHGQQHYLPVKLFGGEEGLIENKKRDSLKSKKCKENRIEIIYFSYKEEITEKYIIKKLKKYLEK